MPPFLAVVAQAYVGHGLQQQKEAEEALAAALAEKERLKQEAADARWT